MLRKGERFVARIEDFVDVRLQELGKYANKSKEKLITGTSYNNINKISLRKHQTKS